MSNLLAIETATNACSVALKYKGAHFDRNEIGNNIHSNRLLDMVAEVLAESQAKLSNLDAIAVGQGPGSFTGLRIGIGVAQGLAYGAKLKMIGVSSLSALAQQSIDEQNLKDNIRLIAGIDARMQEIYLAEYQVEQGRAIQKREIKLSSPKSLIQREEGSILTGNAWAEYWGQLSEEFKQGANQAPTATYPSAKGILALAEHKFKQGELIDPKVFEPDYVRNKVAFKKGEKR